MISESKSIGTTWLIQIIRHLLQDVPTEGDIDAICPWVDFRQPLQPMLPGIESMCHRRLFKTHLPLNNLTTSSKACYVYIARDGRDVVWSLHNHHSTHLPDFFKLINNGEFDGHELPKFDEDPMDRVAYFERWLNRDGYPYWKYWENIASWWKVRHHPQVLLCHYENLKRDTSKEITRIYSFLKQHGEVGSGEMKKIVSIAEEKSKFRYMKKNAEQIMPKAKYAWKDGANAFVNKGTNRRWKGVLPDRLSKAYEQKAVHMLGKDCAYWLATGEDPTSKC